MGNEIGEGTHEQSEPEPVTHVLGLGPTFVTSLRLSFVSSVVYDVSDSRNEPREPAPLTSSLDGLHYDRENRPFHRILILLTTFFLISFIWFTGLIIIIPVPSSLILFRNYYYYEVTSDGIVSHLIIH